MTTASEQVQSDGFEITEGERVLLARLRKDLNQKELGAMVRLSYQTIGSIERGGPFKPIARRAIADALGVSEHWLMYGTSESDETNGTLLTGRYIQPYLRLLEGKGDGQPTLPSLVAVK